MGNELDGKIAIVTGGARGIGRAIAQVFVEEGARVVIADIDDTTAAEIAASLGDAVTSIHADVSDADSVQAAIDHALAQFGALDILVNNAGISGSYRRLMQDDLRDFDRVIAVDLYGVMVGTQRAARAILTISVSRCATILPCRARARSTTRRARRGRRAARRPGWPPGVQARAMPAGRTPVPAPPACRGTRARCSSPTSSATSRGSTPARSTSPGATCSTRSRP